MKKDVAKENLSRNERIISGLKLALFLYLFILAIQIIKSSSALLAPNLNQFFVQGMSPIKAIATGWFATVLVQSSGAVGSIVATFTGTGILSFNTAVYVLMGALIGTAITALLISLITVSQKRRDFRHGFEIGLCYSIYSLLLVAVVFILELFFGLYSKLSLYIASRIGNSISLGKFPDWINALTEPLTNILFSRFNSILMILLGLGILLFTLRYIGKSVVGVFGGEEPARRFINKNFNSKIKAYFLGVFLTMIVFSSSITVSLLVPLAVTRLITLKRAVPFIIGAGLGTQVDVFLASILVGHVNALATFFALFLFGITGAIIFLPQSDRIWKLTKYLSKRIFKISRKTALYVFLAFILLPLVLVLVL